MAPLVSTLCMNLVPAIVAGVPKLCILTKPGRDGRIGEHLLYAADYLNVRNYYKISGSQGLAAVAYGTETIPRADAITGPGNNYTQMAKRLLFGEVKIAPIRQAVEAVNKLSPEHAELLLDKPEEALAGLTNAGAVFVGEYSTEPVGDYFCGTNHILPTCGTARFSSGMSVQEFMRGYSVIRYTETALEKNAPLKLWHLRKHYFFTIRNPAIHHICFAS